MYVKKMCSSGVGGVTFLLNYNVVLTLYTVCVFYNFVVTLIVFFVIQFLFNILTQYQFLILFIFAVCSNLFYTNVCLLQNSSRCFDGFRKKHGKVSFLVY